jgi:glutamate-1-semialdehyde 2,1-aminomutase
VPPEVVQHTLVLEYNNLAQLEEAFATARRRDRLRDDRADRRQHELRARQRALHERLRELCTQHGALLVFDEVMTGFRVALGGAQSVYAKLIPGFKPDMSVFGKVIGGGMPLAAFGGTRDVMAQLAPLGPVYQAGTLSGNPVATACGLATLREIGQARLLRGPVGARRALVDGLAPAPRATPACRLAPTAKAACSASSSPGCRRTTAQVMATDKERFNRFFHAMLDRGVYLAPALYEAGFVSAAHTAGALLIPMAQFARRFSELPKSATSPVLVMCNTQNRSSRIVEQLIAAGYTNASYVQGGMSQWAARGWPLVKPQ